ncbi:MAG: WecB/TagA/CpsF family glycosyltransferase [Candidatus Thiodiazotropha sp. (ex Codakia rugifera)]|nr:WecB/TagA/CpsF family glycosyltransferase [Candidatus Thiodiazotropha sp. (ex Codakia rugifera)]
MRVDEVTLDKSLTIILDWATSRASKYICVSNVHMCMEAFDKSAYQKIVNNSDLVVPDGKPLAVGLMLLGCKDCQQVRGADLTRSILEHANNKGLTIGLYGGTEEAVSKAISVVKNDYPHVTVGCGISPPFHALTEQEDEYYVKMINDANVHILLVGLGCPKQEIWMAKHKGRVMTVMVGVGAVFDFLSGTKKEAPRWLQKYGLEWLFRLLSEPNRLWKRYAVHNPRFIWHFFRQLISIR